MANKKITVFTPTVIEKMAKDAESRLDRMDASKGKKASVRNHAFAQRMVSQMIIMWKTDSIFERMAETIGKK